jgi:polyisoprenyl-teichoic acid--peptidoglycan teichoic acid transferase
VVTTSPATPTTVVAHGAPVAADRRPSRLLALVLAGLLVMSSAATLGVHRAAQAAEGRVLTVLLLGSDAGPPRSGDPARGRADGFQLLFVSADRQHASFISIPRDSWVPVAGRGTTRINSCLTAGPATCARTVEALWGLKVDGWVVTSMWGFADAVNDFGGLVLDATRPVSTGGENIATTGVQAINGYQALTWARDRKSRPGGDFTRARSQAELLAIGQAHLNARGTADAAAQVAAIVRLRSQTSFSDAELAAYALQAMQLPPNNVRRIGLPATAGWAGPASVVFLGPGAAGIVADAAADGILSSPERIGVGARGPYAIGPASIGPLTGTGPGPGSGGGGGAGTAGVPAVPAPPAVPSATLELTDPLQRSPAVRRLQEALNRQGANITVDGVYGPQTARAVAALQSRTARPVDGRVTLELWALLFGTG